VFLVGIGIRSPAIVQVKVKINRGVAQRFNVLALPSQESAASA